MPIVTVPTGQITRPEELVEYLSYFLGKMPGTQFQYIAKYDEQLLPKYPALHIQAAQFDKTLHSTNNFLVGMRAAIHVLHANLGVDRQTRTYEDLSLATSVVNYLESDMEFRDGGNPKIINGFVEAEIPGVMPPGVTKGHAIISTRLNWMGMNIRRFK